MDNPATNLQVGCGTATGEQSRAVGKQAARQAVQGIKKGSLTAVLVFASVRYDLPELLQGIQEVAGKAPVLGATTAGEICGGPQRESVVILALASPHLKVRVGVGQGVAPDWQQAVAQAVNMPEIKPFFNPQDPSIWSELTRQGKLAFGLLFSPGNTRATDSRSFEILEDLKHLSLGRLPIIGGAAADDWRLESNYVLWGSQAYPDSVLVAVFETQLQFGIAIAHGFQPTNRKATVTRSQDHEVLELDGKPAANVYSEMLSLPRSALEGKHLTLTTKRPTGILYGYGQYSPNVASFFTSANGVRFSQPIPEGTVLTLIDADQSSLLAAGDEVVRKAILRGGIIDPAMILAFPCALRSRILAGLEGEEIASMRKILPTTPLVGFYSFGEQGVADDGVSRHNNEVIAALVLDRELCHGARVALENARLHRELEQQSVEIAGANTKLRQEIAERRRAEAALSHNLLELQETAKKLEQSRNMLQLVIESIPVRVFWKDKDLRYLGCNSLFARDTGFSRPEQLLGKDDFDMGWREQAETYRLDDLEVMESRCAKTNILEPQTTPTGDTIWLNTSKVPLQRSNGEVFGVLGVYEDITGRKRAAEEIERQREELRGLATRLAEMEESERQQLARELHDDVCQNLANLAIALETIKLKGRQEPFDHLLSRLSDATALVEQTGEITRNIMEGLRPTVLDHYGLIGGLRQLGKQFSQRLGIVFEIQDEEPESRLEPEVELALFRIAQEALNNVAKHARASQVRVTVGVNNGTVSLTVADNGIGFDLTRSEQSKGRKRWGLVIMNERAMAVGGHCRVESQPGQGTQVVVEVPR
jgi:PAS domain S-box-containing protein